MYRQSRRYYAGRESIGVLEDNVSRDCDIFNFKG